MCGLLGNYWWVVLRNVRQPTEHAFNSVPDSLCCRGTGRRRFRAANELRMSCPHKIKLTEAGEC